MKQIIRIHPLDNVAVALQDLAEGTSVKIDDVDGLTVVLKQPIGRGHKFAISDIPTGGLVIKYGQPIGHAIQAIAASEHIHSHNIKTNLSDLNQYQYQPATIVASQQMSDREVDIYRRKNGLLGIRNELWIVPTVGCVNGIAR